MNKADKIKILVILFFIFSIIHFVLNRNFIIDGEFLFYKGRTSNVDINSETFSTINVLNYSAKECSFFSTSTLFLFIIFIIYLLFVLFIVFIIIFFYYLLFSF